MAIRVFHKDRPDRLLPMISRDARLIVWPGVGANSANMNYVRLEPGEANAPHVHGASEDAVVILAGRGTVADLTNNRALSFDAGDTIHVPPGVEHQVRADRSEEVVSVGGPCPADEELLRAAGALPMNEQER